MQVGLWLAIGFIVACWMLVIGHQLGWAPLSNPDQYAVLKASMFIAYLGSALSFCMAVVMAVAAFKK